MGDTNPVSTGASGTMSVAATINGVAAADITHDKAAGTWSYTVPAPADHSGDGLKTIRITATDAAGKTAEATETITVDTIAPEVGTPNRKTGTGEYIDGVSFELEGSVTDGGTGVQGVQLAISGRKSGSAATETKEVDATVKGNTWSYTMPLGEWEEGTITITATATDKVGNSATSEVASFIIDQNKPVVSTIDVAVGGAMVTLQ